MKSVLSCKPILIHPFHFHSRNVFSIEAHSETLISQFASTKLNLAETDITRILKLRSTLRNRQTLDNIEKIVRLLEKRGCTEAQIVKMVNTIPQLFEFTETILEPKLKVLEDFGFSGRYLTRLLTRNPSVLSLSHEDTLLPNMEFLKNVYQSEDLVVQALYREPTLVNCSLEKVLKPSLAFWEGWGFSGAELVSFLRLCPSALARTSLTPAQVSFIDNIAADRKGKMFKYLVSIVAVSRVEELAAKIDNLELCGLSAEEALQVVRAAPAVLIMSKESVSEKINFLVNNMNVPANCVVKYPRLLNFSLEKTLRPRFLVWQKIKSGGKDLSPFTVLRLSEAMFVSKIIERHLESKILRTIYENALSNDSNRTKS